MPAMDPNKRIDAKPAIFQKDGPRNIKRLNSDN
jgi:hypothetical protein